MSITERKNSVSAIQIEPKIGNNIRYERKSYIYGVLSLLLLKHEDYMHGMLYEDTTLHNRTSLVIKGGGIEG